MIDTAQAYHNEEGVGNTIRKSDIDCKEIFLVSKIWISNYGYKKVKASIDKSLDRLQTDHIDLMLLHQPFCDWYSAYRALEKVYKEGKLRAIGVSNFYPDHFIYITNNMEIVPAVNQVETHVFNQQTEPQKSSAHASCRGDRSPRAETVSSRIQYLPKTVANMGKA